MKEENLKKAVERALGYQLDNKHLQGWHYMIVPTKKEQEFTIYAFYETPIGAECGFPLYNRGKHKLKGLRLGKREYRTISSEPRFEDFLECAEDPYTKERRPKFKLPRKLEKILNSLNAENL